MPAAFFDAGRAEARLADLFGVKTMEAFGGFSRAELSAGAALIAYVEKTQVAKRPPIEPPKRVSDRETMRIDAATRANLELFRSISGGREGTLLAAIDRTMSAAGSRLLAERLASPLFDPAEIDRRLDGVQFFLERSALRGGIRKALAHAPDMLRALSRLGLERGGPRDLEMIRAGLLAAEETYLTLQDAEHGEVPDSDRPPPRPGAQLGDVRDRLTKLADALAAALSDELPLLKRDGGFVRAGYDATLDEARGLRDESRRVIAGLQARYAEETGVRSLKIRHNNVLGYYVEVTAGQAQALTTGNGAETFIHRQTMASAMRFTTTELGAARAENSERGGARASNRASDLRRSFRARSGGRSRRFASPRALSPRSTLRRRSPSWPSARIMCGRRSTKALPSGSRADATRSWNRR